MALFITLVNFTDQGIRAFKDSPKRADAFVDLVAQHGGTVKGLYYTIGQYDLVSIVEAPDAETTAAVLLQVGALGNIRTTTLTAFDRDTFASIIDRAG